MQERNERPERTEPFRRLRVDETICKRLEKKMKQEGFQGAFNNFVETKLMEITNEPKEADPITYSTISVQLLTTMVNNSTMALTKMNELSEQMIGVVARAYAESAKKTKTIVDVKAFRSLRSDAENKSESK